MGDLKVSDQTLRDCGHSLRKVHDEFESAGDRADVPSWIIGHDALRQELRDFADSWDDRRREMSDTIKGLGEYAEVAADTFEELEKELVKSLEEDPE